MKHLPRWLLAILAAGSTAPACAQLIGADFDVHARGGSGGGTSTTDAGCAEAGCVETLAQDLPFPWDIQIRDGHAYVTVRGQEDAGDGKILRIAVGGGTPEILAEHVTYPNRIAVTSDWVYWTSSVASDSAVQRTARAGGGQVETFAAHQGFAIGLYADDERVLWLADGVLKTKAPDEQGDGTAVSPYFGGTMLTYGGGVVYATGLDKAPGAGVYRIDLDAGEPKLLDTAANANALALCSGIFYATLENPGQIRFVQIDGNGAVMIASNQPTPTGVACDGDHVYWGTEGDGHLWWSYRSGGQVNPLVIDQQSPNGVAFDDAYVYWTVFLEHGWVARTPRPKP